MNTRQKIALMIVNLLLIVELCLGMYYGSKDPENLTPIFLKFFFGLMIPTFIIGRIIVRRLLRSKVPDVSADMPSSAEAISGPEVHPKPYSGLDYYKNVQARVFASQPADLEQATKKRKLAGRVAVFFIIILFISLLDSCVARFSQPMNVVHILRGTSAEINGPLEGKIKDVKEVTYTSSSDLVKLSIDSIYSGFWVGGTEWSGRLTVSPDIEPGDYQLTVKPREQVTQKPPLIFFIKVYKDPLALQKSSTSFIKRYSGVSPWTVMGVVFSLTVLTFLVVFNLSKKIEFLMAKYGDAEVYWIRQNGMMCEIAFALGTKHGIKPGSLLTLFDEKGRPVGDVEVRRVSETDSVAIVGVDSGARPGYIVSSNKN
jgi:hypothetical protein